MIRLESVEVTGCSHLHFIKENLLLLVTTRPSSTNAITSLNPENKAEGDKKKTAKQMEIGTKNLLY